MKDCSGQLAVSAQKTCGPRHLDGSWNKKTELQGGQKEINLEPSMKKSKKKHMLCSLLLRHNNGLASILPDTAARAHATKRSEGGGCWWWGGGGGACSKCTARLGTGMSVLSSSSPRGLHTVNALESPDLLAVIRQCFLSSSQVWSIAFLSKSKKDIYCIEIL